MFFVGDRILKNLALKQGLFTSKSLIGGLLKFKLFFNTKIAFSLPVSGPGLNILIIIIVFSLALLIIYAKIRKSLDQTSILLLTIILFGAISNLLDRIFYGAVIDYFDLKYFTIFNLADIMISVSIFTFFICFLKKEK